jgi:hypothetical protein
VLGALALLVLAVAPPHRPRPRGLSGPPSDAARPRSYRQRDGQVEGALYREHAPTSRFLLDGVRIRRDRTSPFTYLSTTTRAASGRHAFTMQVVWRSSLVVLRLESEGLTLRDEEQPRHRQAVSDASVIGSPQVISGSVAVANAAGASCALSAVDVGATLRSR